MNTGNSETSFEQQSDERDVTVTGRHGGLMDAHSGRLDGRRSSWSVHTLNRRGVCDASLQPTWTAPAPCAGTQSSSWKLSRSRDGSWRRSFHVRRWVPPCKACTWTLCGSSLRRMLVFAWSQAHYVELGVTVFPAYVSDHRMNNEQGTREMREIERKRKREIY